MDDDQLKELFRMVQGMGFGARPMDLMSKLLRSYELNVLRQIKKRIDARLEEISKLEAKAAPFSSLDPFSILGVSMDASEEEVKDAYKEKAKKAHPDAGGSDEEMMKINAAFEVIRRFRGWKK